MLQLENLKTHLKRGFVYRREDLAQWSKSVDRHLEELSKEGILEKLSQGLYYFPKVTVFGNVPPDENTLVKGFLKDNRFLIMSPNYYNSLGVGTTQLYNSTVIYNHRRHGEFKLGNRIYKFKNKAYFPLKVTEEFLLVDLANNLNDLAENQNEVLNKLLAKVSDMNSPKFKNVVMKYGSAKTRKMFKSILDKEVELA